MYALYCTDVPLKSNTMPELRNLILMNFQTKDAAFIAACTLIEAGTIVWQIKGPGDDVVERAEIELRCRQHGR